MPAYPWLAEKKINYDMIKPSIAALRKIGAPYPAGYEERAVAEVENDARKIADGLKAAGIEVDPDREIIALIAYLQRTGTDIAAAPLEERGGAVHANEKE